MDQIIEYIKDILDTDDIRVEVKDDVYHITKLFDAKKSDTLSTFFHLVKLTNRLTIESKLRTYLPEKLFKIYMVVINLPEPNIKVKKPSNYYDDLIGGVDNENRFNTDVNIYRNTSFDNVGITIPGQAHNWDYGCYTI
jgi:ribosome-associated translation inhibitor RaiA